MSFYSQRIFPRIMDMVLSTSEFSELRRSLLGEVSGDIFEVGFGTGFSNRSRAYPTR
jgi:hypothetical protein